MNLNSVESVVRDFMLIVMKQSSRVGVVRDLILIIASTNCNNCVIVLLYSTMIVVRDYILTEVKSKTVMSVVTDFILLYLK